MDCAPLPDLDALDREALLDLIRAQERIRQTKRMVDNCGCLAAQAAGVTSAMR